MDATHRVKHQVFTTVAETGRLPTRDRLARDLDVSDAGVTASLEVLAADRLLVLAPESGEIVMAPPFHASATGFEVTVGAVRYPAPCAWDALGVVAALGGVGTVRTSCGDCGDPIEFEVGPEGPLREPCVVHFAVEARRWWDDIVFT